MSDPDLQNAVQHATEKAEELYPRRVLSLKARIVLAITGVIVVASLVLGIVDASATSKQNQCQEIRSQQLAITRNQDQAVVDNWVNGFGKSVSDLSSRKITGPQLIAQIKKLTDQYNSDRANNNASRASLTSKSCK